MRQEIGELVTVRRQGAGSDLPEQRVQRAQQQLEHGQVDAALAEVMRLPARDAAADWIARTRRYVAARRALDLIETAALLDQPTLAPELPAAPAQPAASPGARPVQTRAPA